MNSPSILLVTNQSNINFPFNIFPFLGCPQLGKQLIKLVLMSGCELEPCKKIKRLVFGDIPAVMQSPRDGG